MEAVTSIFGVRSTLLKATMTALPIIHAYLQDALQGSQSDSKLHLNILWDTVIIKKS